MRPGETLEVTFQIESRGQGGLKQNLGSDSSSSSLPYSRDYYTQRQNHPWRGIGLWRRAPKVPLPGEVLG